MPRFLPVLCSLPPPAPCSCPSHALWNHLCSLCPLACSAPFTGFHGNPSAVGFGDFWRWRWRSIGWALPRSPPCSLSSLPSLMSPPHRGHSPSDHSRTLSSFPSYCVSSCRATSTLITFASKPRKQAQRLNFAPRVTRLSKWSGRGCVASFSGRSHMQRSLEGRRGRVTFRRGLASGAGVVQERLLGTGGACKTTWCFSLCRNSPSCP